MPDSEEIISVDIVALVEDQANSSPIVILHDRSHNRLLPIWIGDPEARAISIALNQTRTQRPLTHHLIISVIENMGGKLSKIVVDRIARNTYFSSIYVLTAGDKIVKIDARPSDAIALALEAHAPIFVSKKVMDSAGQENPFPGIALPQEKREFKFSDPKKLAELLERAREREQKASGE